MSSVTCGNHFVESDQKLRCQEQQEPPAEKKLPVYTIVQFLYVNETINMSNHYYNVNGLVTHV